MRVDFEHVPFEMGLRLKGDQIVILIEPRQQIGDYTNYDYPTRNRLAKESKQSAQCKECKPDHSEAVLYDLPMRDDDVWTKKIF